VRYQPTVLLEEMRQHLAGLTPKRRVVFSKGLADRLREGDVALERHTQLSSWTCPVLFLPCQTTIIRFLAPPFTRSACDPADACALTEKVY
jgi:hypothetical protein